MKKVYICWTGGWDSTYRIVELSRMPVEVVPVYVLEPTRASSDYELRAMRSILSTLQDKIETRAKLHSVLVVRHEDIPQCEKVTQAYDAIRRNFKLGSQYEYLGRLAEIYPGIELGIEKPNGEFSGIVTLFNKCGTVVRKDGSFVLEISSSEPDCHTLFGRMSFPIIDKTECDMVLNIKRWGYEDVMKLIHFCHRPLNGGEMCGICRACEQKIEGGMEFLLPKMARRRYWILRHLPLEVLRKIYKRFVYFGENSYSK